jgi:hypothetical protein
VHDRFGRRIGIKLRHEETSRQELTAAASLPEFAQDGTPADGAPGFGSPSSQPIADDIRL